MSAASQETLLEEAQRAVKSDPSAANWHRLGLALQDDGKLDRAITSYRRALRIDDALAEAHNDLGTAYYQKGWYAEAESCFRKAIERKPDHGVAQANLGAALRAQGRLREGRYAFQRALLLKLRAFLPRILQWKVGGTVRAATGAPARISGELAQAINSLSQAITGGHAVEARRLAHEAEQRFPNEPDLLHLVAAALEDFLEFGDALRRVQRAIELSPDRAEYHVSLARLQARLGREAAALAAGEAALRLEPGSAAIHASLSAVYRSWRDDLAELMARRAVELDPGVALGQANLAAVLWSVGRLEEAEVHAREAVRLSPRDLNSKANLAVILKDAGRLDEARQLYREITSEAPDRPSICLNLGTLALECDGDYESARRWYAKAAKAGDDPRVTLSQAVIDLTQNRFDTGWQRYEARKQVADQLPNHAKYAAFPEWDGQARDGRVLVYGEQGLGDEVMFASMFGDLAQRVVGVTVACDPRLKQLFARSFPGNEIVAGPRDALPVSAAPIEKVLAAGSLGRHFRRGPADFPDRPGFLLADSGKTADWRERLGALGPGPKIGISWLGGTQKSRRKVRSIPLLELRALMAAPGRHWISLQYGDCARELAEFSAATGIAVHGFPGVTDDMDDLASLVNALDLVVSVCNATVHIAGAIGKEVLVMAPFLPEWRYGMSGERMLWYSSVRVFRQPAIGDWGSVISAVKTALQP